GSVQYSVERPRNERGTACGRPWPGAVTTANGSAVERGARTSGRLPAEACRCAGAERGASARPVGSITHRARTASARRPPSTIAEVVARYLERAGYRTRIAADGIGAIDAAAEQRPDLVVLDLMLPGIDGLEVMRRLRERDRATPVILLTAKGEESDRVIGLRL